MPASIDRSGLVAPQLVHYRAPDGQQVPAYLFVPPGLDRSKKHPAIVWIHGDGINQNYDGWHVQRNYAVYYSFHQYLLQQGYVVLAPDYRGSIGYGRDWRQGVLHGCRWQGCDRRGDRRRVPASAAVCRWRSDWRVGPQLRRLLHADRAG